MLIYGKNPAFEALNNNDSIKQVYVVKGFNDDRLIKMIEKRNAILTTLSGVEFEHRFGNKTGGIVIDVMDYKYYSLNEIQVKLKDKKYPTIAVLDSLEDPHNLGAILRSADAIGVDAIMIAKNRSVHLSATVAKVSTGAIEYVPVIEVANLVMALKKLKDDGYWVIGLEGDGTIDYRKQDYQMPLVVVIGSEGKGISRLVKETCDFLVKIPMVGHVNSLNASVSAALLFYEIYRQRGN